MTRLMVFQQFEEAIIHLIIKTVFKNITSCKKCKYNPSKKLLKSAVFFSQLLHIICQRINGVPNISKSQSYLQMIDFTVKFISILPIDGAVISLLDVVVLKKKCGWVGKATENGGVNKQFYPPLVSSLWQHCNYAIPNRHLK